MRRRVRAERARANDLEAEQRTVHAKLTVPRRPLRLWDAAVFTRGMARGRETARGGEAVLHDLDRREPL